MTIQERPIILNANGETIRLSAMIIFAVASFFVGGLLREDSIGGAYGDFWSCHWPLIERFSQISWSTAIAHDYCAANNPLLYVIASMLPIHGSQEIYHTITFSIGLVTWPLLAWAYHCRYSQNGIDWLWASFAASAILISPGFRSSAFWGTTDYLPLLFCAATSLLLSKFQDCEAHKADALGLFPLAALASVSACAFYTRQYYAFLPACAAWTVLRHTKTPIFAVISVFFIALLPELFLVYVWKGVNAPFAQFMFHPALINIWKLGAVIGLLAIPIVVGCIQRSFGDVLPNWWGARSTIAAFAGLFIFILALNATEWPGSGGGVIIKAGLKMGALGTPFILTVSYFGLSAALFFSLRSTTNMLLAGAYLIPFFVAAPTYQHYLEPSLVVALFLLADTQTAKIVFNKRVLTYNFIFSALILALGIAYYDFPANFQIE
jgi:hypothetical protein